MPLQVRASKKQRTFDIPVSYRINETRDRLRDALNVFSNQGRLETRFGRSLWSDSLFTGPIQSLSYFKTATGLKYVIAKVGADLYSVQNGIPTLIKSGLSELTKHRGITWARGASSRHIIAIENDGIFQWDGTNFTQLGQLPPEGHTVATTTGTLSSSTYRVHLTFYSSITGFETNSSYSATIATSSQGILVSDIPTVADNATIDKVRVYLENVTTGDDALFVTELAMGTTNYSIATNPTSQEIPPVSNAAPLSGGGKYLVEFNHKLVYAGNDNYRNDVYFSEMDLPDAFNDGQGPGRLVHYATGDGEVTGLATGLYNNSVLDPYLVIFKRRSIEVYSEINGEGRSVTVAKEIGCVSHDTIKVKNGDVYFLSDSGWRVISNGRIVTDPQGNAATLGMGDIDDIFHQPGFTYEVNKSQISNAFSVYYSTLDQYLTWIPEGGSTELSKTYAYEFRVGGFKPYSFQSASTAACVGEDADGNEVIFMSDAAGAIYTHSIKEERGIDEDSSGSAQEISAFGIMTWFDGDDMDASFNWRDLLLRRVAGSGNLLVRVWVNFSLDSVGDPLLFESNETGFTLDLDKVDEGHMREEGRTIETSRADINLCGENLLIGFYQQDAGANLGLVSAQIDFNKNGNRN